MLVSMYTAECGCVRVAGCGWLVRGLVSVSGRVARGSGRRSLTVVRYGQVTVDASKDTDEYARIR